MFSDIEDVSCSECMMERVQKRWTDLLLSWLNKCVADSKDPIKYLNPRTLVRIIEKYKHDICSNDIDRAILCTDDFEPWMAYKYPLLRLRFFEVKDIPKKYYIMATVLLYHCCINSQKDVVIGDIGHKMPQEEQEIIVKFCENLTQMEITINNVERAIKLAYEAVSKAANKNRSVFGDEPRNSEEMVTKTLLEPFEEVRRTLIRNRTNYLHPDSDSDTVLTEKCATLRFKPSVMLMSSCVTSSNSKISTELDTCHSDDSVTPQTSRRTPETQQNQQMKIFTVSDNDKTIAPEKHYVNEEVSSSNRKAGNKKPADNDEVVMPPCKPDCDCQRCSSSDHPCGEASGSSTECEQSEKHPKKPEIKPGYKFNWGVYTALVAVVLIVIFSVVAMSYKMHMGETASEKLKEKIEPHTHTIALVSRSRANPDWAWQCRNGVCQKTFRPKPLENVLYTSLSRCALLCMGPQIWPYPIGYTYFSKTIVALSTKKLEYKFQSLPSEIVHEYLAEAFKLFLGDLARLERADSKSNKNKTDDLTVRKMIIQIDVESDPDPKLKLNTDESYYIKVESFPKQVKIFISGVSFCGVRNGLETLSQLLLLDQSSGYLITLSNIIIKDAPSHKYRGLMIDTGRNYIPVSNLITTIDAMAASKLNTFHWRISDATSFPLILPKLPKLYENGAYDRKLVYTKADVKALVNRALVRGIRVVIEVAAPGPVGRAWSWFENAKCYKKNLNSSCENILCTRISMKPSTFETLEYIYSEIIEMTGVDDVFHMSDGIFSTSPCYFLLEERETFLERALEKLRIANKGFLPKLPIIWYTAHLKNAMDEKVWERMGVQVVNWEPDEWDTTLANFKLIHSSKWDLSCELTKKRCTKYRTWQEMYSWKSWRTVDVFSLMGGEAILWTDLVDAGNLDYHLWPRAAAVAERLWSDMVANSTANGHVYVRLDAHRWRLMVRGVKVQPVWPLWCSFNPAPCMHKIQRIKLK